MFFTLREEMCSGSLLLRRDGLKKRIPEKPADFVVELRKKPELEFVGKGDGCQLGAPGERRSGTGDWSSGRVQDGRRSGQGSKQKESALV
jgi:hypothetical protein